VRRVKGDVELKDAVVMRNRKWDVHVGKEEDAVMELARSAEVNDNVLKISTGSLKAQAQWMMPATNGIGSDAWCQGREQKTSCAPLFTLND
jgi:hypothetical protein